MRKPDFKLFHYKTRVQPKCLDFFSLQATGVDMCETGTSMYLPDQPRAGLLYAGLQRSTCRARAAWPIRISLAGRRCCRRVFCLTLSNLVLMCYYIPMSYLIFTKSSELNRQKAMLNKGIIGKSLKKFEKVRKKQ